MKRLCFISIVGLILGVSSRPLNPKKVLFAINCGAPSSHKGSSGIYYERDIQSDPDTIVADYTLNSEVSSQTIKYTREPDIYMTERHAYKTFSYKVPLQKEGTYVLILKFAEMYFKDKGKRQFHIKFGQRRVVESLDIVEKVGKFAAYDEYIEFEYISGEVFFKGNICQGALQESQLIVQLEKTSKDNPYIHGLVLYSGSLADTDYEDQQDLRRNWERIQQQEIKKKEEDRLKKQEAKIKRKEKVKVRNDHLNELETEFEQDDIPEARPVQSNFSIKKLLMSPIGVITLWGVFGLFCIVSKSILTNISTVPYVPIVEDYSAPQVADTKPQREKHQTSNKSQKPQQKEKAKKQ